jgi:hypothetical protein
VKKTELREGVDYALGSTSKYDRYKAAKVTVVEVDGERERANGTKVKGVVVTSAIEADLSRYAGYVSRGEVERVPSGEWVLRSGRYLREPWTDFEEKRRRYDEARAEKHAERERKRGVIEGVIGTLARYGVTTDGGRGVRVDRTAQHFVFGPDAMAELLCRLDPVQVAEDAIRAMSAKAPSPSRVARGRAEGYDDWFEDALQDVLHEVREGLAVADADIEPSPEDQYAQDFDAATDRAMRSGGAGPV